MPYTVAHAVVGLPVSTITRGKIPLAAVVVGSMSPDFPYFIALTTTEAPGHSAVGVLLYCLVPALLMLAVWYRYLEGPILDLLRLPRREWPFDPRSYFLIVLGVLIGAYSHVLWDATSHAYGEFVVNSEFWQREVYSLPLYKWNQYGSGVVGLAALFFWYLRALYKNRRRPYRGRLAVGLVVNALSVALFVAMANIIYGSNVPSEFAVRSAVGVMAGSAFGMCVYALIVNLLDRAKVDHEAALRTR